MLDNRPEPIFECDTEGKCTWVNEKYCQLLKHDVDYFLGNGWKNGIFSEDLEMVEKEWARSIKDERSSVSIYRMIDREGTIYNVKAVATRNDNHGYIGHIEILDDKKD
jgi:PAS domain S-box-containing protein